MSSIVSITPSDSIVECDVGEDCGTTFRVRNISGKSIKVGAQVIADPGHRSWITIEEPAESRLTANGEARYRMLISVPAHASPGDYRFALLVFDSVEPGEQFDESPGLDLRVVAAPVVAPEPVPVEPAKEPPKRRSWAVTIMVLLATALGNGVANVLWINWVFRVHGSGGDAILLLSIPGLLPAALAAIPTRLARSWWIVLLGALMTQISFLFGWLLTGDWVVISWPVLFVVYIYLFRRLIPAWKR